MSTDFTAPFTRIREQLRIAFRSYYCYAPNRESRLAVLKELRELIADAESAIENIEPTVEDSVSDEELDGLWTLISTMSAPPPELKRLRRLMLKLNPGLRQILKHLGSKPR